jgi:hypothetical protein
MDFVAVKNFSQAFAPFCGKVPSYKLPGQPRVSDFESLSFSRGNVSPFSTGVDR